MNKGLLQVPHLFLFHFSPFRLFPLSPQLLNRAPMNNLSSLIPNLYALGVVIFFVLLFSLEALRPLRRRQRSRGQRLPINLAVTALGFLAGTLTVRPAALGLAFWAQSQSFGLLHLLPLPFWAELALGVLWLDLTFYYWHRLNHLRP